MEKKALLSIGDFSKVTGVGIKALRYYDEVGILPPAYLDPASGYRYYSFQQKAVVDAIQFCVELGIPLKQFPEYTNEPVSWIRYADLVERGEEIVSGKIKALQEHLALLKQMRKEIQRAEISYKNNQPAQYCLPARECWIVPYEGTQSCEASRQLTNKIILDIHENGLRLGNTGGLVLLRRHEKWQQFLFVDVQKPIGRTYRSSQIIHIPQGMYFCKKVEHSDIQQVWEWSKPLVPEDKIKLVIETELFVGNYSFSAPVLEQRCFLIP